MKKLLFAALFAAATGTSSAQEKFGNTLNIGVGLGYYGYYYTAPALHLNYEFDVVRNLTIAPFITFSSYRSTVRYANPGNGMRDWYYRETTIPVGAKASYYFDELFDAGEKWDFYLAGSLGFAFRSTTWESGYLGETNVRTYRSPLFATLHIGSEYHVNDKIGLYLDLATGYTTFGVAIHL